MVKLITGIVMLALLQACVAYPKQIPDDDNRPCKLSTKKYALAVNTDGLKVNINNGDPLSIVVLGSVVFGTTTVVSGSMVIIGNTIHYMEALGRSDDSFLNTQVLDHIKLLLEQGGKVIEAQPEPVARPAQG